LRIDALIQELDGLDALRGEIDRQEADRATALKRYTALIVAGNMVYDATETGDPALNRQIRVHVSLAHAHEMISYEDALLAGALTAGAPTRAEYIEFVQAVGNHRTRYAEILKNL